MKGFGARERNGLIVFCCFVIFFLAIGPVADRLGCTGHYKSPHHSDHPKPNADGISDVEVDTAADSTALTSSDSALNSKVNLKNVVTEAPSYKGNSDEERMNLSSRKKTDSTRIKNNRKISPRRAAPSEQSRRSYLDEPL